MPPQLCRYTGGLERRQRLLPYDRVTPELLRTVQTPDRNRSGNFGVSRWAIGIQDTPPARLGAAGVISLPGGFGGPHPHLGTLILAGQSTKTRTNWFHQKVIRLFRNLI